jgi:hypothetical protein
VEGDRACPFGWSIEWPTINTNIQLSTLNSAANLIGSQPSALVFTPTVVLNPHGIKLEDQF